MRQSSAAHFMPLFSVTVTLRHVVLPARRPSLFGRRPAWAFAAVGRLTPSKRWAQQFNKILKSPSPEQKIITEQQTKTGCTGVNDACHRVGLWLRNASNDIERSPRFDKNTWAVTTSVMRPIAPASSLDEMAGAPFGADCTSDALSLPIKLLSCSTTAPCAAC